MVCQGSAWVCRIFSALRIAIPVVSGGYQFSQLTNGRNSEAALFGGPVKTLCQQRVELLSSFAARYRIREIGGAMDALSDQP